MIADHRPHQRDDDNRRRGDHERCLPPPDVLCERGDGWQDHQLAGRGTRSEDAHHQPATLDEPSVGDGRRQDQGHRPRAGTDEQSPEHEQLPRGGHGDTAGSTERHQEQRRRDHPAHAEPVHQAAANGATSPNRTRLMLTASDMTLVDQPNSSCSGTMSAPGAPGSLRRRTTRGRPPRRPTMPGGSGPGGGRCAGPGAHSSRIHFLRESNRMSRRYPAARRGRRAVSCPSSPASGNSRRGARPRRPVRG